MCAGARRLEHHYIVGAENTPMTAEAFGQMLSVSRETLERLKVYLELLSQWQNRINLVGRSTMADPWRRHILDSAQLTTHLPDSATVITDFGSGAGFPGLVLAIMTGLETHLIESNRRKCAFLHEAARRAGAPVTIHAERIEAAGPWQTDVLTARALAPLSALLQYALPFLEISAHRDPVCLFLKGARVEEELTDAGKRWHMEMERHSSHSGEAGTILRIRGVSRG